MCSNSNTYAFYAFINDPSSVILPVLKYLNLYVPKSILDAVDNLKYQSPALMTCYEMFRFNTNAVNRYLPNII